MQFSTFLTWQSPTLGIQYKSDCQCLGKKPQKLLDFKLLLDEELIARAGAGRAAGDSEEDYTPPRQKWKPQLNAALRQYGAVHLPEMVDETHASRCGRSAAATVKHMSCAQSTSHLYRVSTATVVDTS